MRRTDDRFGGAQPGHPPVVGVDPVGASRGAVRLRRFDEFRASLGIASNVLAARLDRLCTEGLLQRQAYQARPERHEYLLTDKGRDLAPALLMIMKWGDRYYPNPAGPPRVAVHSGDCAGQLDDQLSCDRCALAVGFPDVEMRPGPGMGPTAQ
ncbi:MAG: helix-turn-helix transcriptional regulator [Actinomycetota bacterium]|nr:helix-turn-helix transcriptional regulator [Actinomycetota bacterium]